MLAGLLVQFVVKISVKATVVLPPLPHKTYPTLDPLIQPYGGAQLAANVTHAKLFFATKELGTYNMSPMLDFHHGQLLAWWKNSPKDEDQPGQRVLYSQSMDGVTWSPGPDDQPQVLFPNMSTNAHPAALFAEPMLHISGRYYAAASPNQFCLYPDQVPNSHVLLRRVDAGLGKFGPVFWMGDKIPAGFEEASVLNSIGTVTQQDSTTKADIATLADWSKLPCSPVPSAGYSKCEACVDGCADAGNIHNATNEQCHYAVPGGSADVIMYRVPTHGYGFVLASSVRPKGGNW